VVPFLAGAEIINDAAAFAVGEAWVGQASGSTKSVSITIGTGLGSGFINEGIPVFKGMGVPTDGFIWDLPYKNSVADDYFSTRGLIKTFYNLTGKKVKGVKEIAMEADNDNTVAIKVFQEFGEELATLLTPCIKNFGADILVIGGNISKAFNFFGPTMNNVFSSLNFNISVKKSELNEKAQIFGSSRLLDTDYWQKLEL